MSGDFEQAFYRNNGDSVGVRYARALTFSLVTVSGVGSWESGPQGLAETLFVCFAVSLGTSFYLFTVGSITSLIASADAVTAHTKAHLAAIKKWMARAGLPPEIRLRIMENFYAKCCAPPRAATPPRRRRHADAATPLRRRRHAATQTPLRRLEARNLPWRCPTDRAAWVPNGA